MSVLLLMIKWHDVCQSRKDTKKTGLNLFFTTKARSEKSNLLVNTTKFMTFLNKHNIIVNNFSRLVIGYRRQTTTFHWLKIWQVELRHCLALIRDLLFSKLLFRTGIKSAMFIVSRNGGIFRVLQSHKLSPRLKIIQRKDLGAVKTVTITKRDSFGYFNSSQVEVMYSKAVWWERLAKQFWKVAYRKLQSLFNRNHICYCCLLQFDH